MTLSRLHCRKQFSAWARTSLLGLVLLASVFAPLGVEAAKSRRDPIWGGTVKDAPAWLAIPDQTSALYSEYELDVLAGHLIVYGAVDASQCPDSGLLATGEADKCGVKAALPKLYAWQNQFNPALLSTAQDTGVPPIVMKNIFAWESQFWPSTVYINTSEYGFGHLTEMGADSALRWNAPFYDEMCAKSFAADTCEKAYSDQPPAIQSALRGVVVQQVRADCAACDFGLDLRLAQRSIPVFAQVLLANASFVKQAIRSTTGQPPADIVTYEDFWKFTLASYNAGPGCFSDALSGAVRSGSSLTWSNLSARLAPGCRGAIPYVAYVSNVKSYYPDHDPSVKATSPATPGETASATGTGTLEPSASPTATLASTEQTTPVTATDTGTPGATPSAEVTSEPSATPTATLPGEVTSTPEASDTGEPTATPPEGTSGPTETSPADTPVATATPGDSATPVDTSTVSPTGEVTESATPTLEVTATSTPAAGSTETSTTTPTPFPEIKAPHAANEVVLKIDPHKRDLALQALTDLGINLSKAGDTLPDLDAVVVEIAPQDLGRVLAALKGNPGFDFAEPNYLVQVASQPNDPGFSSQNNLWLIQVPPAWDALPSLQDVTVAVIDTGVDASHPDLSGSLWENVGETGPDANGNDRRSNGVDDDGNGYVDDWQGWNTVAGNNNVADSQGHGTHIAGIIAAQANNSVGIAGIAPNARVLPVKVLDKSGFGTYAQVAEGIIYATNMGARVIELGFGGTGSSQLMQDAIDYATLRNVLVVAAAGNGGDSTPYYPAAYPGVMAVSAVDDTETWASFSSNGPHISLSAPGVGIYSTFPDGGYRSMSGTSMASAQVAGVAALLAGQPQFADAASLRSALIGGALDLGAPGKDPYYGYGMLRAFDALQYAGPVMPTPTPWLVPTSTPGGPGGVSVMASQDLWATSQISAYTIYDAPSGSTPGTNSIDGAFNDNLSYSTGIFGGSSTRHWTFTAFSDITDPSITSIWKTYLDMRFYVQGWTDDPYVVEINNGGGWSPFAVTTFNASNPPPSGLVTLSWDATFWLGTTTQVNNAQVRIRGLSGGLGANGVGDNVTIYVDEVRLRPLNAAPTPTPTPLFVPTSTLGPRAMTATPLSSEPHHNFQSADVDRCASCHRSHSGQSLALRDKQGEEQVCFSCHTSGGSGTNVQPAFTSYTNTQTRFFKHDVANTTDIHQSDETVGASFGGANRHIECEDCHSPHTSSRTAGSASNSAPAIQQVMFESAGVDPAWTAAGVPTSFNWLTTAQREYQICFKCHSSYTSLPTYQPDGYGWDGTSALIGYVLDGLAKLDKTSAHQVPDSRDLATEFSPYQASFHPVAGLGRNRNMPAGSFVSGWSQNSILYCSDCHSNADATSGVEGPHGSPLLHLLQGSTDYVTKIDPSASCNAVDGCPQIHDPGELCFKCHQYNTYALGTNPSNSTRFKDGNENLHAFHSFAACYTCHDTHGSEQAHLINFDTSVVTTLPGYDSQSAWTWDNATNTGTCYVACHGFSHGSQSGTYTP